MSPAKFPARKLDGSFCVVVSLGIESGESIDLLSRVQSWMATVWMPLNSAWTWDWKTGANFAVSVPEILMYADEFSSPPEISQQGMELRVRFFGKRDAKFWRDWIVLKFVPDIKAEFQEVGGVLHIRNCAE